MPRSPEPQYDYQTNRLAGYYQEAIQDILTELERIDLDNFRRANALATLKSISEILSDLDEKSSAWVKKNVPKAPPPVTVEVAVSGFCPPYSVGLRNCRSAVALWLLVAAIARFAKPPSMSADATAIVSIDVEQAPNRQRNGIFRCLAT